MEKHRIWQQVEYHYFCTVQVAVVVVVFHNLLLMKVALFLIITQPISNFEVWKSI